MGSAFLILVITLFPAAAQEDRAVTKVVKLLQEMLDKSKADGATDREVYAKFKCYCDKNTAEKTEAISQATINIERMAATLADRRGQNEKLSLEVEHLRVAMEENAAARAEAEQIRGSENTAYTAEKADLTTGIAQLDRAVGLLAAVGGDQTAVAANADNEQFMAADATAEAKAHIGFLQSGALSASAKEAIRAASVFLSGPQRKALTGFLQAPTGNYNSQSGEITGVLKSMSDTFKQNLKNANTAEEKALAEYNAFMAVKTEEHETMTDASEAKSVTLGDNAAEIATTSSQHETASDQKVSDQEFLAALTARCEAKKKQYDHRNMLRANEDAAIAQAVAILNSDAAFSTFGNAAATSSGATSFVQLSAPRRARVADALLAEAQATHSRRLSRVAAALKADNPFNQVIKMIDDMVSLIDKEEDADVTKKNWCESERTENNKNLASKKSKIGEYQTNINNLEVSAAASRTNIEEAESDLADNLAAQQQFTETRDGEHAQFRANVKNLADAERILAKATEVLTKYYAWLHKHNAAHHYEKTAQSDSGGGNLERMSGASVPELEAACSERPDCVGFNTAGWLKQSLAPKEEWYAWDGGDIYEKKFDSLVQVDGRTRLLQTTLAEEPEDTWGSESKGQSKQGNKVINMLEFIASETTAERELAEQDEADEVEAYEGEMRGLKEAAGVLNQNLAAYKLDLARTLKQLEEAQENLATTQAEKAAIEAYLAKIAPGCDFIKDNYQDRKAGRIAEKSAMNSARDSLKNSAVFQAAQAKEEREALGKCAGTCEEKGMDHAKCASCLDGVTLEGYCAGNEMAKGC